MDTQVASQVVRIDALKKEDTQRHQAFEASLAAAVAGGDEQPDQEAVARAHSLVRTPTERTELMQLDGRIAARNARQQPPGKPISAARWRNFPRGSRH